MPKRLSALTIAQRSAAQYEQKFAPTYSSNGFLSARRNGPEICRNGVALPAPTESARAIGTAVTCFAMTAADGGLAARASAGTAISIAVAASAMATGRSAAVILEVDMPEA